ncbi:MAG: hypothetical protein KBT21_11445 [Treponema sp.]|nr:hypothetical protein [Candidatus Treponema merdequi]
MLLPDNIKPEYSIYYVGSVIIEKLKNKSYSLLDLFQSLNELNDVSFSLYSLALDWLYLIDMAEINDSGEIVLCS